MKKITTVITVCIIFAILFSLCGCSELPEETAKPTEKNEENTFDVKNTDEKYKRSEATCSTRASYYFSNADGEKGTEVFYAGDTLPHNMVDGVCTVCRYTEGAPEIKGDKVTFGSYPQSEVKNEELKAKLDSLAGELPENKKNANWTSFKFYYEGYNYRNYSWYIDVELEGEKYRGIYFTKSRPRSTDKNASQSFQLWNGYEQNTVYWFKYEPINWTIISQTDDTALIFCDNILDATQYYDNLEDRTDENGNVISPNNYENSSIRKWLNSTFLNAAFTELQASLYILDTTVDNSNESANPTSRLEKFNDGVNPFVCGDTQDKVFLLSYNEVTSAKLGFKTFEVFDDARKKVTTAYAISQGTPVQGDFYWTPYYSNWWLRTPDYEDGRCARTVYEYGFAYHFQAVNYTKYGVVPAMTIKTNY